MDINIDINDIKPIKVEYSPQSTQRKAKRVKSESIVESKPESKPDIRLSLLERQVETLKRDFDKQMAVNEELKEKNSSLESELDAIKSDCNASQTQLISGLQNTIQQMSEEFDTKCEELSRKSSELCSLNVENNVLKQNLIAIQKECKTFKINAKRYEKRYVLEKKKSIALQKKINYYSNENRKNKLKLLSTQRSHSKHDVLLFQSPWSAFGTHCQIADNMLTAIKNDLLNSITKSRILFKKTSFDATKRQIADLMLTSNSVKSVSTRINDSRDSDRVHCSDCNKTFAFVGHLTFHMTRVHGIRLDSTLKPVEVITIDDD